VIRTREPFASSTSIVPVAGIALATGSAAIRTAANSVAGCRRAHSLSSPSVQLAWMNPGLPSNRRDAGPRLKRCRHQSLLLRRAPAAATLHRGDYFNCGLAHVTIPMGSHMTHTSRGQQGGLHRADTIKLAEEWLQIYADEYRETKGEIDSIYEGQLLLQLMRQEKLVKTLKQRVVDYTTILIMDSNPVVSLELRTLQKLQRDVEALQVEVVSLREENRTLQSTCLRYVLEHILNPVRATAGAREISQGQARR
jgi:hypothetical protein